MSHFQAEVSANQTVAHHHSSLTAQ